MANKKILKYLADLFLISSISLILLEIGAFFLLKFKVIKNSYAKLGIEDSKHLIYQGFNWRNEKEKWGAWHKINSNSIHKKSCFDVEYKSNNIGARDEKDYFRNKSIKNSIVLLGDSFAEGYGIDFPHTFASLLEKETQRPVFNFGSAYNFGPLQYYLIYKNLAKNYKHETLVIFFLPSNDFIDNDPKLIKKFPERYRPYYLSNKEEKIFTFKYPKDAVKRETIKINILGKNVEAILFKSSAYKIYKNLLLTANNNVGDVRNRARWYFHSEFNREGVLYYLEELIYEARKNNAKEIVLFAIPSLQEIELFKTNDADPYKVEWVKYLKNLDSKLENFTFLNWFYYLNINHKKYKKYFLKCDPHWSEEGHIWAKDVIRRNLKD